MISEGDILESSCLQVDLIYIDPPFFTQRNFGDFEDRWDSMETYLEYVTSRISAGWDLLNDNGNFLLHVDYRTAHKYREWFEQNLPQATLQNEIIWKYNSGGASKRRLSRKHDTILWYTKGDQYTFNAIREPYPRNYGDRPGFNPDGKLLSDVWTDIGIMSTTSKERVYSTQKPLELLKRCVLLFSNEGDTVLDFFAGSGTTGVAARLLNRNYVLMDINPEAVEIAKSRISGLQELGL